MTGILPWQWPDGTRHAGFTGTRTDIHGPQIATLAAIIDYVAPDVLHMGDCQGADVQAANIARSRGCRIVAHPPERTTYRAFYPADDVTEPAEYLFRNRQIIRSSLVLIAAPATRREQRRSGTWYTIRHARALTDYPVLIAYPDGAAAIHVHGLTGTLDLTTLNPQAFPGM